jgi:hypothetical protein
VTNDPIKLIKRRAFGYTNLEHFRLRILTGCVSLCQMGSFCLQEEDREKLAVSADRQAERPRLRRDRNALQGKKLLAGFDSVDSMEYTHDITGVAEPIGMAPYHIRYQRAQNKKEEAR